MYTDFRLKIRHFFRKNAKIILIVFFIWIIVFFINRYLKNLDAPKELQTTYDPHTSVMDSTKSVSKNVSNVIEDMIEEYVGYCNEGNYQKAFNMLSEQCRKHEFENDVTNFMAHVLDKMPTEKKYAIQDYSNDGNMYIYQVKFSDDLLATGLTNSTYQFTEEKFIFKKQRDGSILMSVGNFVDYADVKNIFENEYLKIDVKSVAKYYSLERYEVRFTNRSEYTIVIADSQEEKEAVIMLESGDYREWISDGQTIVLKPNESYTRCLDYHKFYDNKDNTQRMVFNTIRVMEQYSGTEDVDEAVIQQEKQNAIAKFSANISVEYED